MKLTQPVLCQSFEDEFELPESKFETPVEPGTMLMPEGQELNKKIINSTGKSWKINSYGKIY